MPSTQQESEASSTRKKRRGILAWWAGTKPTDLLSVVVSVISVGVAGWALYRTNQVSQQQAEASAPVLAAGTPLRERGQKITVTTDFATVVKRADRMFLDRRAGRVILPLLNGGSGIAMTIGLPLIVADCTREPAMLPASAVRPPLGTYVIPSGGSDQLGYLEPKSDLATHYLNTQYWYSTDYKRFGMIGKGTSQPGNLLIWYTDGAQRKLRWTCLSYTSTPDAYGSEWAPVEQQFGNHAMVPLQPSTR